jgi:hypothetical protein
MNPVCQSQEARQEAGEPSRCDDHEADDQSEETDIVTQVIALKALTTADLRIEWRKLYRATPPSRLSRDLLIRGVAYRIQERAHGGLSLTIRRRLRAGSDQRDGLTAAPAITLKPGTKLVREWHRHAHTVSVLDEGFEYQGERYNSLTRIARRITGAHWSGPLFFGISKRRGVEGAGHE